MHLKYSLYKTTEFILTKFGWKHLYEMGIPIVQIKWLFPFLGLERG